MPTLPPIHSKFLESQGADIDRVDRAELPVISDATNCTHYFVQKRSNEIECRSCLWGLYIDPTVDKVKDGRLYKANNLVV